MSAAPTPDADRLMLREATNIAAGRPPAAAALQRSAARLVERMALQPMTGAVEEPLPIDAHRAAIIDALREHQVLVVAGETGSGKTTQLPRFALAAGFGRRGMIGHTQPRRLAARAVATRIAAQTGLEMGQGVGYAVRFDDRSSPLTLVRLMTDGILLNALQRDPQLLDYELIIIDEAHERSLNIDFLLGYLAILLPRRPDLKLIITSATIDHQRFARHFGDAPVIEVSGRGYPVSVEYAPDGERSDDSRALARRVCDAVGEIQRRDLPPGARDILVFLPGEREIRDAERALQQSGRVPASGWTLLPLFGRLSDQRQGEVFADDRKRRIVLATNVAETSLTVPRIGAVIDSGLARVSRYSHRSRIQRLQLEPVSQASANQRAGRCGRIGPGLCLRLYSEADFEARPAYTDAEILRTNLASVVLQMLALNLGDIECFPFLDQPDPAQVSDAHRLLQELGATSDRGRITRSGRRLSQLPLDPRLGRMLLEPIDAPLAAALIIIVAGLSIQEPRIRPAEALQAADAAHAPFSDPGSDFIGLYRLWCEAQSQRRALGRRAYERWCESCFLSPRRMREWREVATQLARQLEHKLDAAPAIGAIDAPAREAIHRAMLTGLLSQVGIRDADGQYDGAERRSFRLHASSSLQPRPPKWVMALEIVQTHQRFARYAAAIDSSWLLTAGKSLLDYEYEAPYWNARRGRVEAQRTTLLFGLVVEAGRRVDIAGVNRELAREVFIRQGLVAERVRLRAGFIDHNRRQRERVRELAGRLRRAVEISDDALAALYEQHLPAGVCDARSLKRWLSGRNADDSALHFSEQQLLGEAIAADVDGAPLEATLGGNRLSLRYQFEPGKRDDGVTLRLPAALLGGLRSADIDACVPAFLERRVELRLRALPKPMRKRLHPLANTARTLAAILAEQREAGTLDTRLARLLLREFELSVDAGDWQGIVEPAFLRPRIEVIGDSGERLDSGRDTAALQQRLHPTTAVPVATPDISPAGVRDWPWGVLPRQRGIRRGEVQLTVYPALQIAGASVNVHEFLAADEARRAHDVAVLRLLRLRFAQQVKTLRKTLLSSRAVQLLWAAYDDSGAAVLIEDFTDSAFRDAFGACFDAVRDRDHWLALCEAGAPRIVSGADSLLRLLHDCLQAHAALRARIERTPEHFQEAIDDVRQQADSLVRPGFLMATPADRIADLPRYLTGAALRLERIASNPSRDTASMAMIISLASRLASFGVSAPGPRQRAALEDFRWQLQELRVSLFAQSLGTRDKVSVKRLENRWDEILRISD